MAGEVARFRGLPSKASLRTWQSFTKRVTEAGVSARRAPMHVACPGNGLQVRHSLCQVPPEAGTASEVSQMGRGEKEPVWRQSGSIWKSQVSQVLKERAEVHNPSCLDDLGRRVTCWLTVHCIHSQRNHRPGALRVFASWRRLFSFSSRPLHLLHSAKAVANLGGDHSINVLDQPATLPRLNPLTACK